MKYSKLLQLIETVTDQQYIEKLENMDPNLLDFYVSKDGNHWTLRERKTNIILFKSYDEDYTDETCDMLNSDKDNGKDAVINAVKTLYMN